MRIPASFVSLFRALTTLLLVFFAGCVGPQPGYAPFFAAPQKYSRVAIACVDVRSTGDPSDRKNRWTRQGRDAQTARAIAEHARKQLTDRLYQVVETPPAIFTTEVTASGSGWTEALNEIDMLCFTHRVATEPFDARVSLSAPALFANAPDVDAWLIVISRAQFEEKRERSKRIAANVGLISLGVILAVPATLTGTGPAVASLGYLAPQNGNWMRHAVVLVDPKTGQALWCRWAMFPGENARSDGALEGTVANMFDGFPDAKEPKSAERPKPPTSRPARK